MMRCHTWSTRIEIPSVEDDDNFVNVIAANLHLEWFRVERSKDVREVAKGNALQDLSPRASARSLPNEERWKGPDPLTDTRPPLELLSRELADHCEAACVPSRDVRPDESPRLTLMDVARRTHHGGWPPRSESTVLLVPLALDRRGLESRPLPEKRDESKTSTRGEVCEGRGKSSL
jgi:hypothetical protein